MFFFVFPFIFYEVYTDKGSDSLQSKSQDVTALTYLVCFLALCGQECKSEVRVLRAYQWWKPSGLIFVFVIIVWFLSGVRYPDDKLDIFVFSLEKCGGDRS